VRAWVACFRSGCRKSPRAFAWSERAIRSSPGFLGDPRASFSFRRRGCFAEPIECEPGSLGLGKFAGRAPEPLHGARGRSGVLLAFCTPLAREGLFAEPPSGAIRLRSKRWLLCHALHYTIICSFGSMDLDRLPTYRLSRCS